MRLMIGLTFVACSLAGAAHADDKMDQAFGVGQMAGSATFCGVDRPSVNALVKAMLDTFGIDSSGPSPAMTRFTEGVTDGANEMKKTPPPATCDEVKQGFEQMKASMKQ